jgi:regulator of RNase E activity RraB
MGLTINQYPVYKGSSTVEAYVNIRDINQNKVDDGFTLQCFAGIKTKKSGSEIYDVSVESLFITLSSTDIFADSWEVLYTELKRVLTDKEIIFVDS